jgi:hypothetical protein
MTLRDLHGELSEHDFEHIGELAVQAGVPVAAARRAAAELV